MEYRTKVTVSSALIGILTLTAVLGWVFSQQAVTQRQVQEPLLVGYQAQSVTGLEFGSGIQLAKAPTWVLRYQGQSFPAASDRIETYLNTLQTLQRDRLVTREGDGKAFGLDQGFQSLTVKGASGQILAELQVGNLNDQGTKVYVRLAGQKEIWETDPGFSRNLEQDFNTWADLSLFPGKKAESLTRIAFDSRIETADKTIYAPFDLVKLTKDGKTVWEDRITKVSTEPMASWANLVATFRFGAFASPSEPPQSTASLGTLTLTWADGSSSSVKIGPADGENRYPATEGTRNFWINDWALGQLLFQ